MRQQLKSTSESQRTLSVAYTRALTSCSLRADKARETRQGRMGERHLSEPSPGTRGRDRSFLKDKSSLLTLRQRRDSTPHPIPPPGCWTKSTVKKQQAWLPGHWASSNERAGQQHASTKQNTRAPHRRLRSRARWGRTQVWMKGFLTGTLSQDTGFPHPGRAPEMA